MYVLMEAVLDADSFNSPLDRQDDKTAGDFGITPGAVLHLVLALRGGL